MMMIPFIETLEIFHSCPSDPKWMEGLYLRFREAKIANNYYSVFCGTTKKVISWINFDCRAW